VRYLSVCSGIEAASVAWHSLGWVPVAFSEIEKFPCAVLAHHYPNVPNWGDMTKFQEWPDANIDVLVGGTPCQSFSVAGLRRGLADPRGNLMLTYLAILDKYRPAWLVWENVPGVLSSNKGRDFGTFLGALGELGYGWAYRSLDAQYFHLAQRRERVFVVGCLGDWKRAAQVFSFGEGMSGYPPPSRETRQDVASPLEAGSGERGYSVHENYIVGALNANGKAAGSATQQDAECGMLIAHALRADGFDASEDGTGRGTPLVPVAIQERAICENPNAGPDGAGFRQDGLAYTLEARTVPQAVAFDTTQITSKTNRSNPRLGDPCHKIAAQGHPPAIAFGLDSQLNGDEELIGPLTIGSRSGGGQPARVATQWAVRRITVTEAERLQGFEDGYTAVPYRGKMAADGPRYRALGNSMAVPCMRYLGERIQAVEEMKWK
jgi:DNA (cytosine-5)-methyltransferase 1